MQKSFVVLSSYLSKSECVKPGVFWVHLIDLNVPSYKILLMQIVFSGQGLEYREDLKIYITYKILTE